ARPLRQLCLLRPPQLPGAAQLPRRRGRREAPGGLVDRSQLRRRLRIGPSGSNDDHPPSDVKAGQELVLKTYSALVKSPNWSKTMLVITYDEHGGFYDHVPPPARRTTRRPSGPTASGCRR